jgi:urease accessory protein
MGRLEVNTGEAHLHIGNVAGRSTVIRSKARNPLRLLTPRARGESVWAYTSSFGGGMVAGDCTRLELVIDAGARCFLSTQASTKIYRNPQNLPCSHELAARVDEDAVLVLAPDPVQCFAESIYEQRQQFHLAATGNLLLVDWISAGRTACGERWNFQRYSSRNVIERDGRKLLIDALRLDSADGALDGKYRGGRFNSFATVVVLGPRLNPFAKKTLNWCNDQPIAPNSDIVFAGSPLHDGVILRFVGISVEQVGRAIHEQISFISQLLEDDPWSRKW